MQAHVAGHEPNRLSLLGMEMERSTVAPMIASPAAEGWGPTVAMPTLMGMMPEMPSLDDSGHGEQTLLSVPGFTPDKQVCICHSYSTNQTVRLT